MNTNPETCSRPKAIDTLKGLLHLLHAFHKENKGNNEHSAKAMCYKYFGLEDIDGAHAKKVPHLEMVRFANLQNIQTKFSQDKIIPDSEVDKLIKDHLFQMTRTLIEKVWNKHQQIIDSCTACPRFITEIICDVSACKNHHSEVTRQYFADRFYALLFLVRLEQTIAIFLKDMRLQSAKVKNQLRELLFIHPEFVACDQLYELLFPRGGNFVASYFLTERDVLFLRRNVSSHIKEFAKAIWYSRFSEEERWTSSDLIIEVSNLLHLAGGSVDDLLSAEERKFENRKLTYHPGMFSGGSDERFNIFSRALEGSKFSLYLKGDVLGSIHAAVKQFLFTPAKRKGLPYPSIANAVMILERHLTTCLMLHARLMMNDTIVCLPESYLSMISFWDLIDRPQTKRSTTFNCAIQYASQSFQDSEAQRNFNHLHELALAVVQFTLGKISSSYNMLRDAFSNTSVHFVEVERVLVLVLTMLCNCGRGIPKECEVDIREQLFTLQLHHDVPQKLKKCVEDARNANGFQDIVVCLRELLIQKPRQERLLDVKWDELRSKGSRLNCRIVMYSKHFCFKLPASTISKTTAMVQSKEPEATEDEKIHSFSQVFNEGEGGRQRQKYSDKVRKNACLVISRAYLKWRSRKEAKEKLEIEMKNDAVKRHFQSYKLDKYGCTICGRIQFVDRSPNVTETTPSEPSLSFDPDKEETWKPRIMQRNTFEGHCSGGSPYWKKEKSFARFRTSYRIHILPTIKDATQLLDEMRNLREETEMDYSFDIDRLSDALSRLQIALKKIEDACLWDCINMTNKAVEDVNNTIRSIKNTTAGKGNRFVI